MLEIRQATTADTAVVADMIALLLSELGEKQLEGSEYTVACEELLGVSGSSNYTAFLAWDEKNECAGIVTVAESCSIYAKGRFGVIQELYVRPSFRSKFVGRELVNAVVDLARSKGWSRIEVGAPDRDKWGRTVEFYKREGFVEVGPRLKLATGDF